MNICFHPSAPRHLRVTALKALSALLLVTTASAIAGPGAHGPNGEHLDAPTTTRAASALPRVEAQTEAFELVAELRATELAILEAMDHFLAVP